MDKNKQFEIWLGHYHLGQGNTPPSKPQKVAIIQAPHFRAACSVYELQSSLKSLKEQIDKGNYISDPPHLGIWFYNHNQNSNGWTGQYYETEEEAWGSFPSHIKNNLF